MIDIDFSALPVPLADEPEKTSLTFSAFAMAFSASPEEVDSQTGLPTRFRGIAYRGDVIKKQDFSVVIDLETVTLKDEAVVLLHHDRAQRIGKARLSIKEKEIHVEGIFSSTAKAIEVRREMRDGFGYELSLGVMGELHKPKEPEMVNGFFTTAQILKRSIIRELSFVTFGAANNTKVLAFAQSEITHSLSEVAGPEQSREAFLMKQLFNQVSGLKR